MSNRTQPPTPDCPTCPHPRDDHDALGCANDETPWPGCPCPTPAYLLPEPQDQP